MIPSTSSESSHHQAIQSPIVLLLDTTGQGCHVGLVIKDQCYLVSDLSPQSHAKQLLSLINQLLNEHNLTPAHLTGIVYTQGPGAFTGIRIGISVVQGLSLALNIPTLGVSSLQALAWQAGKTQLSIAPCVLVAIDARMKQVYWAVYQFYPDRPSHTIHPEAVGLPDHLPPYDVCVGDGINILFPDTHLIPETREIQLDQLWQMVQLGLSKGWLNWSSDLAIPVYLRPESALISK